MATLPEIVPSSPSPANYDGPLLTHAATSLTGETGNSRSHACGTLNHFAHSFDSGGESFQLTREKRIREALLLLFCDPIPVECFRLWLLTRAEWRQALHWLDVSSLALYFLDRVEQENLSKVLPDFVYARLSQNLADNRARTAALLEESAGIHQGFQNAGLSYATLKGFSLGSLSVPKIDLRCQLDFDFLVAGSSALEARRILESRGYHLRVVHGRSWEFSAHDEQHLTLRDLYKPTPHRYIELHIEPAHSPLLDRAEIRRLHGVDMPVLEPVDLFLGQGLHIFRHLRNEATRASHLLEFRRHVMGRANDQAFWDAVRSRAELNPQHAVGLGIVLKVIEHLMGAFAPAELTSWTVDDLSHASRAWVETCARDAIFACPPSTKMFLILQDALASADRPRKASLSKAFVPTQVPRFIAAERAEENIWSRARNTIHRLGYNAGRTRFYLVEGTRYLCAFRRYRKAVAVLDGSRSATGSTRATQTLVG